ncbi:hypothetical protein HPO96_34115 [Kribbella sandramycini]|uniref:Uncharacterized protein n=1 Tax=Kribbella sandramycini TaxID=60450 RepID=A0A7Y4L8H6_9ACTN|nr:hypothetical protein [Kribbella sandramycini]MBB6570436.1 hypothetical protein [Kribbella sandramycini]NOL45296.1 hypothetical protein [Kribbella sandramycini]
MGEGRWVLVRAGDGKALQGLRQELAEQDLATQEMPGSAIAVGLAGGEAVAATVVGVLRDWIHRRRSPERVELVVGEGTRTVERATVDAEVGAIEAFLVGR